MLYLDCESAGLRGDVFAAALIDDNGVLFDGFYRHPELQSNSWLRENVEPNLTGTEYPTLQAFQAAFAEVWNAQESKACVCHMGAPVESNFFQQLFDAGEISEFGGMYPMLDTAPLLEKAGFYPTSELAFCAAKGLELPEGKLHSALFDAQVTKLVWSQF
jgi:hypothetical protein